MPVSLSRAARNITKLNLTTRAEREINGPVPRMRQKRSRRMDGVSIKRVAGVLMRVGSTCCINMPICSLEKSIQSAFRSIAIVCF